MSAKRAARRLLDLRAPHSPEAGLAWAVLGGDPDAAQILGDIIEEAGLMRSPFETGKQYLICTVTLYYIGRVKDQGFGWLLLDDASWVHWTGRLSVLLQDQNFTSPRFSSRRPRLERCGHGGEVGLATDAIVSWYPWTGSLPKECVS
jgi:hypothetical protein